jgi:hypothetical protein
LSYANFRSGWLELNGKTTSIESLFETSEFKTLHEKLSEPKNKIFLCGTEYNRLNKRIICKEKILLKKQDASMEVAAESTIER